ncbi:IS30 family transposase [Xiamenia xianingshaonis]|uniref:IS30 family transposase n=2 Tax=Xiamenia xianingshaonis TaxID=2682776 RepID=A0A9E6MR12_9ACTN|nr:IS30 family transposase [Xiamenia xianingshaonis]NGM18375.1 IS30 family transposase [Eggerthellaceae bacterium zg-893]NHM13336.1 IS30 family transposase [Xiamenia xianingshaonis]QTU84585.1 IS30 family transposase [Xiamenia xianingshaonis]
MRYDSKTRYEAVAMVKGGATLRGAEAATGVSRETIRCWCRDRGVRFLHGRMGGATMAGRRSGKGPSGRPFRLGLDQRLAISVGLSAGRTHAEIAEGIGFSRPTVSREVSRHRGPDGSYDPYEAQADAEAAAARPKPRKVDADRRLRSYVLSKLLLRWSPRQISARLERDFPDDEEMRMSHESIYQALYVQGKGALRQELKLEKALRSGRKARLPRSRLAAGRGEGGSWVEGCEISLRPAEAADRAVPGHWEGDLVIGGDLKSCLVTLVERTTRLVLVRRLEAHPSKLVTSELADMAAGVPSALMRTVTWDRGMEMASHAGFTAETGVKVYFCDPHSPWQRGTNENTNGLVRDYFPKGTDFSKVTDEEVREMQDQLNGRPRETLGWRTPAEAYAELLGQAAQGALTA